MDVSDQLPCLVRTLSMVITEEHCHRVDWQDPQVGAAPATNQKLGWLCVNQSESSITIT